MIYTQANSAPSHVIAHTLSWLALVLLVLQLSACKTEDAPPLTALVVEQEIVAVEVVETREPKPAWQHRNVYRRDLKVRYGHDRFLNLMAAQIYRESLWVADAESWVGAYGCGQFMPATQGDARYWASDLGSIDWGNCRQSVRASIRYMKAIARRITPPKHATSHREAEAYVMREAVKDYNRGMGHGDKERRLGYCVRRASACDETEAYHVAIFGNLQTKFFNMRYGNHLIP